MPKRYTQHILVDQKGRPSWMTVATSRKKAWKEGVLWHTGSIYGRDDYNKKRRKMLKEGWTCQVISYRFKKV